MAMLSAEGRRAPELSEVPPETRLSGVLTPNPIFKPESATRIIGRYSQRGVSAFQ